MRKMTIILSIDVLKHVDLVLEDLRYFIVKHCVHEENP